MSMSIGGGEDEPMMDINMTPLIDVMLVLLIMFIITIPVMTHAVKLDMPRASNAPSQVQPVVINLEIDFDGTVLWNGTPVEIAERYPAHLHMNLLLRLQRRGVGSLLLGTWLAAARIRGARSFHVGVNRMSVGALRFWEARGFAALIFDRATESRTCWMGRDPGEPQDQDLV